MKQKTPDIGNHAHAQIAATLPQAIETAMESYHDFMTATKCDEKSKEFKDHHTAAKAALAHIELLLKLAAMVDVVDTHYADDLIEKLRQAQTELDNNE